MLIGAAVMVHVYRYDDFTTLILRFLGSEDKLQQFRTSFLTPQKFFILRIFTLGMAALFGVLVLTIRASKVIMGTVSWRFHIPTYSRFSFETASRHWSERELILSLRSDTFRIPSPFFSPTAACRISTVSRDVVSSMWRTQSGLGSTATTLVPKEAKTAVIVPTLAPISKTRESSLRREE